MSKPSVRAGGLNGKVAVITAGSTGIGFAIARRLAQDGAHVVISSRNQKHVNDAMEELKKEGLSATGIVCHVGKSEDRVKLINETVRTLGGLDILVSNAAVNPTFGPMLQTTEAVWDKIFDVNLKGTFFLIKEAAPHIEKRGGGSVILVSSQGGYNPAEFLATYSVSKTAMLGLTKALVPQLAQMNIRVNAIAPGVIKTNFSGALWKDPSVSDEVAARIPMKRLGVPDECAGAVSFLVSSDASYITGETIVMNGGSQSRL